MKNSKMSLMGCFHTIQPEQYLLHCNNKTFDSKLYKHNGIQILSANGFLVTFSPHENQDGIKSIQYVQSLRKFGDIKDDMQTTNKHLPYLSHNLN